jgi:hypothetical protein
VQYTLVPWCGSPI